MRGIVTGKRGDCDTKSLWVITAVITFKSLYIVCLDTLSNFSNFNFKKFINKREKNSLDYIYK